MMDPVRALTQIWRIITVPWDTKEEELEGKISQGVAIEHYRADLEEIRKTIRPFIDAGFLDPTKE